MGWRNLPHVCLLAIKRRCWGFLDYAPITLSPSYHLSRMEPLSNHISPDIIAKLLKIKMNRGTPRRAIGGSPLFNLSSSSLNPSWGLSPDPPLKPSSDSSPDPLPNRPKLSPSSLAGRVRSVFPPGFESSSSSHEQPYSFAPHLLYNTLNDDHSGNRHVASTVVKSAWYCKQKESARHEFIILCVSDLEIPGLENYIALDRNQGRASSPKGLSKASAVSSSSLATDAFRISYDGDLQRFLHECRLTPYLKLEEIEFPPHEALPLLKLVGLVVNISNQHPKYHPADTNCYWFTGLIWECVRRMYPTAKYEVHLPGKKGRIAFLRSIPNPVQVWNALWEIQGGIEPLNSEPSQDQDHPSNESGEIITMEEVYGKEPVGSGDTEEIDRGPCLICYGACSARR